MRLDFTSRVVILSITSGAALSLIAWGAAEKRFEAGPAAAYAHQQSENVTVGAKEFTSEEDVASAFGKKVDFEKYGVVPLLVVIENKREQALDLRQLEANLVASDGRQAKAVSPENLPYLATEGKHRNQGGGVQLPLPVHISKKNPLSSPDIVMRAFAAKMLAPGDSASGFLYFEAKPERGDKLYLNGLSDARSRQELLYFEFPLNP